MISKNEIRIIGNVGSDPVVRESNNGKHVQMSVATSESWTTKEGEQKSVTQWHNVVLNGNLCEFADVLTKGMHVCVFGKVRTYQFQDNNGAEKLSVKVIAQSIFVGAHELKRSRHDNKNDNTHFDKSSDFQQFDDVPF